MVLGLYCAEYS